ncbi:D-xylulose reductase [Commensalibacter sp. Nvir]|uniref:NAD(P)-dependent alcohol dehydrogenase n=1 Tax=Commensalibacter sp. Nvir TaxID=3069817 RepID=UPI002D241249|nr:D-xylulose reductase [Commensalibacter sp. Nvir]
MSKAVVLEHKGKLSIRDIELPNQMGEDDVRIKIHTVGICGSDVHYYTHGKIGPFVVTQPMVLGHEASGIVTEVGANVKHLKKGDRVCMEPGIPNPHSKATKLGIYNVDPDVVFWATPPIHGCLTESVVHPASYTFKLPDNVSFAEGAFVEPLAIGIQACVKAKFKPGDVCLVAGCGPIGILTALSALASGASKVFITDVAAPKLEIVKQYSGIIPIHITQESIIDTIQKECGADWGVDVAFEASGHHSSYDTILTCIRPGGTLVFLGLPVDKIDFDLVTAQSKEITMETVFRYANVYDRAVNLIASGKINLHPLISGTYPFSRSIEAFERAASAQPNDVKLQIQLMD